jgi:predicted nucleic acid-binding protein
MFRNSFNISLGDYDKTNYAVDSTVYISFKKVGEIGLLLKFCEGHAVLTPKIEKELFPSPEQSATLNYNCNILFASTFEKWISVPVSYSTFDPASYFHTASLFLTGHRNYFYIANINYVSTTSTLDSSEWQYDYSKLNSDPDKEIVKWVLENYSNAELLTNDRKILNSLRSLGLRVTRSAGILCRAIQKGIITFKEAGDIYNQWVSVDPGSCVWKKNNGVKEIISFDKVLLHFNF